MPVTKENVIACTTVQVIVTGTSSASTASSGIIFSARGPATTAAAVAEKNVITGSAGEGVVISAPRSAGAAIAAVVLRIFSTTIASLATTAATAVAGNHITVSEQGVKVAGNR